MKSIVALGFVLATAMVAVLDSSAQQDKKTDKKPVPKKTVATDPKDAGIDFQVQGEYEGSKLAAQVFAFGEGKFDVYFLAGGLPGAGWDGKSRVKASAILEAGKTSATVKGAGIAGTIAVREKSIIEGESEKDGKFTLTRVIRKSPTLGAKPPADAKVLFDGTNVNEWKEGKLVGDLLGVAATTKEIGRAHV